MAAGQRSRKKPGGAHPVFALNVVNSHFANVLTDGSESGGRKASRAESASVEQRSVTLEHRPGNMEKQKR
jgi:hypothetical protein